MRMPRGTSIAAAMTKPSSAPLTMLADEPPTIGAEASTPAIRVIEPPSSQRVARREREVDLAHQLVGEAEAVGRLFDRRRREFGKRREIDAARGAGDRVERPGRLEARDDAGGIGDVDADLARLRSRGDDVVPWREFGDDRPAERAAGADDENAQGVAT